MFERLGFHSSSNSIGTIVSSITGLSLKYPNLTDSIACLSPLKSKLIFTGFPCSFLLRKNLHECCKYLTVLTLLNSELKFLTITRVPLVLNNFFSCVFGLYSVNLNDLVFLKFSTLDSALKVCFVILCCNNC